MKKSENPKNVFHIGGIRLEFPYKPYGTQMAFMSRVISTLDRAQRDGHCHALLESPTGTGKSLSLLCSAIAWQQQRGPKSVNPNPSNQPQSRPDSRASSDPLNHGGGFVVDSQLSETPTPEAAAPDVNGKSKKQKPVPTIFYASRTHSQISQVIREYRKTTYRISMAILASRKYYCTNARVRSGDNLDEDCKLLLEDKEAGCPQFKNAHRVRNHPSFQRGGCHEVHDIEDLVKVGKTVKGCSYFAARSMADDAQIVFCPYSYIINPIVRKAMEVDIKGAILILDEAHNIEDLSREVGSVDVDEDALQKLQTELGQLCGADALTYQPLYEMVQDVISWMERRKDALEKREFLHYFSCWTGDKALRELQEANISQQCFPILQECAAKAIRAASDAEQGLPHLSGMSRFILEGLFSSLSYFFHGNGSHINDYQLVIQRFVKKDSVNPSGSWKLTLGLWCLNPAVVFRDIADLSLSVILTSGTLSPMTSFSSELGVPFGTLLEAPHVINVDSQVWASIISTGPCDYPLNASYKTADGYPFQDAVGKSLEEVFKVVPGGSLVFFPSYKLMEKLCKRWRETGQWSRLNRRKTLFIEARGGSQEDFETVLKGYYSSIRPGRKLSLGKRRKAKKVDVNDCTTTDSLDTCKEGAAFLAVCRGKVSEGIDFSDDNARAVIIVGIPFPNINDVQVAEKKKYNDTYRLSKNLLSGSDWYCQQAFRALNQAAGRCIRHKSDYGAVIFLDERFREERNTAYISKWLRKSIRTYEKFETSIEELRSFFCNVKEQVGDAIMLDNPVTGLENIPPDNSNKGSVKRKSQKFSKSEVGPKRMDLDNMVMTSPPSHCLPFKPHGITGYRTAKSQCYEEIQESSPVNLEKFENQIKTTESGCNCSEDTRCEVSLASPLDESPELSVVKETPVAGSCTVASPEASMNDDNSNSTIIQTFCEFGQVNSLSGSIEVTPERNSRGNAEVSLPEIDSTVNLSVNSRAQKKRALLDLSLVNPIQDMKFDVGTGEVTDDFTEMDYTVANGNSIARIKPDRKTNSLECEPKYSRANEDTKSPKSSGLFLDQQLQVFCALCRSPLGRPENNSYISCSSTSLSKVMLTSLSEGEGQQARLTSPSLLPILIVDVLSVDQRIFSRNKDIPGQGIWSQDDGCVYNTIFCPFCVSPNQCLGVQILATDVSNLQLINKILFLSDRLEVRSDQRLKRKDSLVNNGSQANEIVDINSICKYAYQPQQQSQGGWRMTKQKSRILKRSPTSQFQT